MTGKLSVLSILIGKRREIVALFSLYDRMLPSNAKVIEK